jgi:hypothetical protein
MPQHTLPAESPTSVGPNLRDWLEAQLAAGLPAFTGSAVAGTLAMKTDLLNELIGQWLTAPSNAAGAPPINVDQLKPLVKAVTLRAESGAVLVDFRIAV